MSEDRFQEILNELALMRKSKGEDYDSARGLQKVQFANIRAGEDWGVAPWIGCMIRATDKLRRIQKVAQGGTLANEGVRDSFIDLAVYTIIGLILWEETQIHEKEMHQ